MEQPELIETRKAAQAEIFALRETTPSTRILDQLGKAYRKGSPGYWISVLLFLNLIILGPWLLIGLTRDGLERTRYVWAAGSITAEFVIAGLILADVVTRSMLEDMPVLILDKLTEADEVSEFSGWLRDSLLVRSMAPFVLGFWLVWTLLGVAGQSTLHHEFVGIGFSITVLLEGFLAGIALYAVLWITRLAYHLRRYQYELNKFSPVSSEILHNIYELIKKRAYTFSAYFFVFMLITSSGLVDVSSRLAFALPGFVFIWGVMIAQFLVTRSTIELIIDRGKWKILNKLTAQINLIEETGDLSDRETAQRLLRLGKIHNRVMASRESTFDFGSFVTLLSQLMLPILGLLLGNMDKVTGLLR